MRLEQMRENYSSLSAEGRRAFVLAYRDKRAADFIKKEAQQAQKAKKKATSGSRGPALTDDEKNLCKLLKITQKQFREIKASQMELPI